MAHGYLSSSIRSTVEKMVGKLYVVATPIGNLGDITARAQETLRNVTLIAAEDTRHSQGLLTHLGIGTPLVSYHAHNERERTGPLIERLQQGESIALISDAGTPGISDPGYYLVQAAHQHGITVVPVVGACAAIAALCASGLASEKFLFEGFLPAKGQVRTERLIAIEASPYTVVLYEAPHRIIDLLTACGGIFAPTRRCSLAREITKRFETIVSCDLKTLLEKIHDGTIPEKGEFVLVIEGKPLETDLEKQNQAMEAVLRILLAEVSVKQAVRLATQLTPFHKNALYDCAMRIKNAC